jgi:hypothetical protein
MGVSGQRHVPAASIPGEGPPGTHWIGGSVGPRAGLEAEARIFVMHHIRIMESILPILKLS